MDPQPLHLVHCKSEINQVSLVQYVRADSPEAAMVLARVTGVTPLKAGRLDEANDWMLDAVNRNARAVAGAHDALRSLRHTRIIEHPTSTIFWASMLALLVFAVLGILFQLMAHLR